MLIHVNSQIPYAECWWNFIIVKEQPLYTCKDHHLSFYALRTRRAIVSANVHGQSCQMHLISPAWQQHCMILVEFTSNVMLNNTVELFLSCEASYMLIGILHAAHSKWDDQANDELRLSPRLCQWMLYIRIYIFIYYLSSLLHRCGSCEGVQCTEWILTAKTRTRL